MSIVLPMVHTTTANQASGGSVAHRGVGLAFAALVLAMLPAVLDQTILATALPTIAGDLGHLGDVSWLVTAYVVAATATTPLWGKLGDRYGHKRLLQISLTWFVAASALCGAAQDITQLIVVRAVQGVAAGGLMTLAMAAVGDLVSPRERGRYQGYIAATFAGAAALGPLAGGLLVDHASWRWIFYVNVPVGAAALVALRAKLPAAPVDRPTTPLDALGGALLAAATGAFMLVCVWGGDRYGWGSIEIAVLIAATVVLSALLVLRERRAADPIVPVRMLATPAVAVASAGLFFATATTTFFRALGGAVGAAGLGAVFTARAGAGAGAGTVHALSPALRVHIADAVQAVFLVAAPLAAVALIVLLWLPEAELKGRRWGG